MLLCCLKKKDSEGSGVLKGKASSGQGRNGTAYKAVLEEVTTVVVKRLKEVVVEKNFEQQMEMDGSLATLLYGNRGDGRAPLDWTSELRLPLELQGPLLIHSVGSAKFAHGNIKSSNVLLNQDIDGCVSDFGLAPLMNFPPTPSRHVGYCAPEVDLPRWVQSVVREEWTAEVFDVELMKFHNIKEEMVQMLQIAMVCVVRMPRMRPNVDEVVRMIEEIQQSHSENQPCSEENKSMDSNVQTP
ncbi:hypothetical protein ACSBR2_032450 [Camellia fascicularis]